MPIVQRQLKIALILFGVAALLGTYLRFYPLLPSWANYKFILHTHSHTALIGWVYLFLGGLIVDRYCDNSDKKIYKIIYRLGIASILGMLFRFPFQGYALWSIVFSTLFLFVSYAFIYWVFQSKNAFAKKSISFKFIKSSLIYLAISSIGPWALGIIMAIGGKDTIWYQLSVYFYLHFQYNGWMLFGLFGLFYALLESWGVSLNTSRVKKVYRLLQAGVILSFFSNVLWTQPPLYVHIVTGISGLLLLWSLWHPYQAIKHFRTKLNSKDRFLLVIIITLLILKSIALLSLSIPSLSKVLHQHRDLIIAFIHMNFIGIVSLCLFWIAYRMGCLSISKTALGFFLIGFITTELVLVIRSAQLFTFDFTLLLSLGSSAITLGVGLLIPRLKKLEK